MPTIVPSRQPKVISTNESFKSENNDDCDPFHDSDNDKDPDFIPPPNKIRKTSQAKLATKRKPTKRDRIQRLKEIAVKYARFSTNSKNENVQPSAPVQSAVQEQRITTQNVPETPVIVQQNFDYLFDIDNETEFRTSERDVVTEISQAPSENCVDQSSNDIIVDMRDHILNLINEVTLLRKQVARIEMKTSFPIGQSLITDSTTRNLNNGLNVVESDDLLDFDSTLAREGLPLKNFTETNDFEFKLRSEPQYRTKIVCIFVLIEINFVQFINLI